MSYPRYSPNEYPPSRDYHHYPYDPALEWHRNGGPPPDRPHPEYRGLSPPRYDERSRMFDGPDRRGDPPAQPMIVYSPYPSHVASMSPSVRGGKRSAESEMERRATRARFSPEPPAASRPPDYHASSQHSQSSGDANQGNWSPLSSADDEEGRSTNHAETASVETCNIALYFNTSGSGFSEEQIRALFARANLEIDQIFASKQAPSFVRMFSLADKKHALRTFRHYTVHAGETLAGKVILNETRFSAEPCSKSDSELWAATSSRRSRIVTLVPAQSASAGADHNTNGSGGGGMSRTVYVCWNNSNVQLHQSQIDFLFRSVGVKPDLIQLKRRHYGYVRLSTEQEAVTAIRSLGDMRFRRGEYIGPDQISDDLSLRVMENQLPEEAIWGRTITDHDDESPSEQIYETENRVRIIANSGSNRVVRQVKQTVFVLWKERGVYLTDAQLKQILENRNYKVQAVMLDEKKTWGYVRFDSIQDANRAVSSRSMIVPHAELSVWKPVHEDLRIDIMRCLKTEEQIFGSERISELNRLALNRLSQIQKESSRSPNPFTSDLSRSQTAYLFWGDVSVRFSEQQLVALFDRYNLPVECVSVTANPKKPFAYVRFTSVGDCRKARQTIASIRLERNERLAGEPVSNVAVVKIMNCRKTEIELWGTNSNSSNGSSTVYPEPPAAAAAAAGQSSTAVSAPANTTVAAQSASNHTVQSTVTAHNSTMTSVPNGSGGSAASGDMNPPRFKHEPVQNPYHQTMSRVPITSGMSVPSPSSTVLMVCNRYQVEQPSYIFTQELSHAQTPFVCTLSWRGNLFRSDPSVNWDHAQAVAESLFCSFLQAPAVMLAPAQSQIQYDSIPQMKQDPAAAGSTGSVQLTPIQRRVTATFTPSVTSKASDSGDDMDIDPPTPVFNLSTGSQAVSSVSTTTPPKASISLSVPAQVTTPILSLPPPPTTTTTTTLTKQQSPAKTKPAQAVPATRTQSLSVSETETVLSRTPASTVATAPSTPKKAQVPVQAPVQSLSVSPVVSLSVSSSGSHIMSLSEPNSSLSTADSSVASTPSSTGGSSLSSTIVNSTPVPIASVPAASSESAPSSIPDSSHAVEEVETFTPVELPAPTPVESTPAQLVVNRVPMVPLRPADVLQFKRRILNVKGSTVEVIETEIIYPFSRLKFAEGCALFSVSLPATFGQGIFLEGSLSTDHFDFTCTPIINDIMICFSSQFENRPIIMQGTFVRQNDSSSTCIRFVLHPQLIPSSPLSLKGQIFESVLRSMHLYQSSHSHYKTKYTDLDPILDKLKGFITLSRLRRTLNSVGMDVDREAFQAAMRDRVRQSPNYKVEFLHILERLVEKTTNAEWGFDVHTGFYVMIFKDQNAIAVEEPIPFRATYLYEMILSDPIEQLHRIALIDPSKGFRKRDLINNMSIYQLISDDPKLAAILNDHSIDAEQGLKEFTGYWDRVIHRKPETYEENLKRKLVALRGQGTLVQVVSNPNATLAQASHILTGDAMPHAQRAESHSELKSLVGSTINSAAASTSRALAATPTPSNGARLKRERSNGRHSRSPDRSRNRSPDRFRNRSPDRSRNRSPDRSRNRSPDRSRNRSPDRSRNRSSGRSGNRSPERFRNRSPDRFRNRSPDRFRNRSPDRFYNRSPEHFRNRSPDRCYNRSPDRFRSRSPARSFIPQRRSRSPPRSVFYYPDRSDRSFDSDRQPGPRYPAAVYKPLHDSVKRRKFESEQPVQKSAQSQTSTKKDDPNVPKKVNAQLSDKVVTNTTRAVNGQTHSKNTSVEAAKTVTESGSRATPKTVVDCKVKGNEHLAVTDTGIDCQVSVSSSQLNQVVTIQTLTQPGSEIVSSTPLSTTVQSVTGRFDFGEASDSETDEEIDLNVSLGLGGIEEL